MGEWLCCLARTIKVLGLNLGATRHRMTFDKSLMTVCLGSPRETLCQPRAPASNSCRKNIGLSKLSPDSILYRKVGYSFFLSRKQYESVRQKSLLSLRAIRHS
jgi:hypothetical protein